VHVMSTVVKGAIGVGSTAASLSISIAETAVLTGVRVLRTTVTLVIPSWPVVKLGLHNPSVFQNPRARACQGCNLQT
jgi:hypothetical protein